MQTRFVGNFSAGGGVPAPRIRRGFRQRLAPGVALITALLLAGTPAVVGQQTPTARGNQEASAGSGPRVAVGEINGSPGSGLMVPLYFTPDPRAPLRAITVDIDYVSNSLKFQKASRGIVTEQVGADLSTTLTDGKPDARKITRSKLRVAVAIPEREPKQGLPEGLLAYLLFQVSTDAKAFAIRLNTSVVSAETIQNPPQKVAKVNTAPGLVVVELADMLPEGTCFFFNH